MSSQELQYVESRMEAGNRGAFSAGSQQSPHPSWYPPSLDIQQERSICISFRTKYLPVDVVWEQSQWGNLREKKNLTQYCGTCNSSPFFFFCLGWRWLQTILYVEENGYPHNYVAELPLSMLQEPLAGAEYLHSERCGQIATAPPLRRS